MNESNVQAACNEAVDEPVDEAHVEKDGDKMRPRVDVDDVEADQNEQDGPVEPNAGDGPGANAAREEDGGHQLIAIEEDGGRNGQDMGPGGQE